MLKSKETRKENPKEKPCEGQNLIEKIQEIYDENEQILIEFHSRVDHLLKGGRLFNSSKPSLVESQNGVNSASDAVKEKLITLRKVVASEI